MSKVLFIVNPISGGRRKRSLMRVVMSLLDRRYYQQTVYTEYPGHATELARETDADIVVAVGGDGTVHEVAKGLLGTEKVLGIIPCGSGDGLALHLGISRELFQAVHVLNRGEVRRIDCGEVDGEPFFCTTGMGLDADVAWRFASSNSRGVWTYISLAWKIWRHYKVQQYKIEVDGKAFDTQAVMVTVANVNQWGNQARIAPQASVEDGLLDVAVVLPFRTREIPVLAAKLMDGRAHTSSRTIMLEGREVRIIREAPGAAHCDGEPSQKGTRLEARIVPSALRVMAPRRK